MSTSWASPSVGVTTKAALQASSAESAGLFITNRTFQEFYGNKGPILFWLNLGSKAEVDALFAEWKAAQAKLISEPEDKPWKLREFMAADLDGNLIRVFYDFHHDI